MELECGDVFCSGCIHTWNSDNNTCPLCRHKINDYYQNRVSVAISKQIANLEVTCPFSWLPLQNRGLVDSNTQTSSNNNGSDNKSSDNKSSDNNGSDNNGSNNKGSDNKSSDNNGSDNKSSDNNGSDNNGSDNNGSNNKGSDNKGSDNKGSDNKGSDNKGSDNKGSNNKGRDNNSTCNDSICNNKTCDNKNCSHSKNKELSMFCNARIRLSLEWKGVSEHLQTCLHGLVACGSCNMQMQKKDLAHHKQSVCIWRWVQCPHCNFFLPYLVWNSHVVKKGKTNCVVQIACPAPKCNVLRLSLKEMDDHIISCGDCAELWSKKNTNIQLAIAAATIDNTLASLITSFSKKITLDRFEYSLKTRLLKLSEDLKSGKIVRAPVWSSNFKCICAYGYANLFDLWETWSGQFKFMNQLTKSLFENALLKILEEELSLMAALEEHQTSSTISAFGHVFNQLIIDLILTFSYKKMVFVTHQKVKLFQKELCKTKCKQNKTNKNQDNQSISFLSTTNKNHDNQSISFLSTSFIWKLLKINVDDDHLLERDYLLHMAGRLEHFWCYSDGANIVKALSLESELFSCLFLKTKSVNYFQQKHAMMLHDVRQSYLNVISYSCQNGETETETEIETEIETETKAKTETEIETKTEIQTEIKTEIETKTKTETKTETETETDTEKELGLHLKRQKTILRPLSTSLTSSICPVMLSSCNLRLLACRLGPWPKGFFSNSTPLVPENVNNQLLSFIKQVNKNSPLKKLQINASKGQAHVEVQFSKTLCCTLVVNTYQMLIFSLFNSKNILTTEEIVTGTGVSASELCMSLLSLAQPKARILLKAPFSKKLNLTDQWKINQNFKKETFQFKTCSEPIVIPLLKTCASAKEMVRQEEKKKSLYNNRVCKAFIIREMKTVKVQMHDVLKKKVQTAVLNDRKITVSDLIFTEIIDKLINDDYLEKCNIPTEDLHTVRPGYRYIV
jgi:hypothetical protein